MNTANTHFQGIYKSTGEDGLAHEAGESGFFALAEAPAPELIHDARWAARAQAIGARPLGAHPQLGRLAQLWQSDPCMSAIGHDTVTRLQDFIHFYHVDEDHEVIRQDELGDFMVVLLEGSISVLRRQDWGELLVLAAVSPGEVLGEMSLLDGGARFSSCLTRSPCQIGVIAHEHLQQMIVHQPQAAALLIGLLARKLSLRLRVVSARLGGRNT